MAEEHIDDRIHTTVGEGKEFTGEEQKALDELKGDDRPPNRLCIDPKSPHFDQDALSRGVAIVFKGRERSDVHEYDVKGGWIKVLVRDKQTKEWARGRNGKPLTQMMFGVVLPSYRRPS